MVLPGDKGSEMRGRALRARGRGDTQIDGVTMCVCVFRLPSPLHHHPPPLSKVSQSFSKRFTLTPWTRESVRCLPPLSKVSQSFSKRFTLTPWTKFRDPQLWLVKPWSSLQPTWLGLAVKPWSSLPPTWLGLGLGLGLGLVLGLRRPVRAHACRSATRPRGRTQGRGSAPGRTRAVSACPTRTTGLARCGQRALPPPGTQQCQLDLTTCDRCGTQRVGRARRGGAGLPSGSPGRPIVREETQ